MVNLLKLLVKLAIAALIANASWHLGSAYMSFYRFKDAVQHSAQFSSLRSDDQIRQRVLELASDFDVPVTADLFTVRRETYHIYVNGAYTQPVQLLPGYTYAWPFTLNIDVLTGAIY
jgi:hypothetical protein